MGSKDIKKTENTDICALCGSRESNSLFSARDHQYKVRGLFQVVQCRKCGLIFLNPMPQSQVIRDYYAIDDYYSYSPVNISFSRKLKDKLLCLAANIYFKTEDDFIRRIGKLFLLPILKKLIPMSPFGKKFLDVGCGNGRYMLTLRKMGWEVYGCELSKSGVMVARQHGLNVSHGTLFEARYPTSFFDAIRLEQVFEHIDEPDILLQEIRRILKTAGLLIIGIPNSNSLSFRVFRKHWGLLGVPFHLFQYSHYTLKRILSKNGFQIVELRYISMPQCWIWSVNNFINEKLKTKRNIGFLYNFFFWFVYRVVLFPIIRFLYIFHQDWSESLQVYAMKANHSEDSC